jgi:ferritin-like metal-binding protein YciE
MFKNVGRRWIKEVEGLLIANKKFSKMRETKMKEGIVVDPQLKQLIEDHVFSTKLNTTGRRGRSAF